MEHWGRFTIGVAMAGSMCCGFFFTACSSGDDSGVSSPDAAADAQSKDVASDGSDSGGSVVCAPTLPAGYASVWAPPATTNTACTSVQVQGLWDACFAASSTKNLCNAFYGVPANSPCIACMVSQSTSSTYGAVVDLPNGSAFANKAGCIALTDGDLSATGCGAKYEALQVCQDDACDLPCPLDTTTASYTAYQACENASVKSVCAAASSAAACAKDAKYARCNFASYEAYVIGIGDIMCASGVSDAGVDSRLDAGDAADD